MSDPGQLGQGWDASREAAGPTENGSVLTSGACAVVALVLSVAVLMGNNLMVTGSQALVGNAFSSIGDVKSYLVTTGVATLVPVVLSLLLAQRALATGGTSPTEATLARAATMLALIAAVYAVLTLVGGLAHQYDDLGF